MKLTRDTLIEGQIIKKGTEIRIVERREENKPMGFKFDSLYDVEDHYDKIFHTSPNVISKINKNNHLFEDSLFFSDNIYSMGGSHVYSINIETYTGKLFITGYDLIYRNDYSKDIIEFIEEIKDMSDSIDDDIAEEILAEKDFIADYTGDYEDEWTIQSIQGKIARKLGYLGFKGKDEQGTVYIIPMYGREDLLVYEGEYEG